MCKVAINDKSKFKKINNYIQNIRTMNEEIIGKFMSNIT
jgi:hypothetical protein